MEHGIQRPLIKEPQCAWTDAHAHLSDLDPPQLSAIVTEAHDAGFNCIINTATSLSDSTIVCQQCTPHPLLSCTVGISPFDVADAHGTWYQQLRDLCNLPQVVGIGETGIDASNPTYPPVDLQQTVFEKHLELAMETDLPIVIHSRGSEQRVLDICLAHKAPTVVFHCYTGDSATMERIVDAGYMISFSGIITFTNTTLIPLVRQTPLSNILIETDSPYLAPVPFRGKPNRPALAALVGCSIAKIKQLDEAECAQAILKNFRATFAKRFSAC
jgi:TatD DNase family protein